MRGKTKYINNQLKEVAGIKIDKSIPVIFLVMAMCIITLGCSNNEKMDEVENPNAGYLSYRQYCAPCHGLEADGNGPVAPSLKVPPADLTKLGKKYGMPLPKKKIIEFIDGRQMVRTHGTSDMPVWGNELFETAPSREIHEAETLQVIESIVIYLDSIQDGNNEQ